MDEGRPFARSATITLRPSAAEKLRFSALAQHRGISESRLGLEVVAAFLSLHAPVNVGPPTGRLRRVPATDRLTIRLRPGDRRAIAGRAAYRGTTDSGYVAALVRAHLICNPPLALDELTALKGAIGAMTSIERHLQEMARTAYQSEYLPDSLGDELVAVRAAVASVERAFHEFTRTALRSWEVDRG